jgi:hypothetical protein
LKQAVYSKLENWLRFFGLRYREYVAQNPVKAGLVDSPEKYPYCLMYLAKRKKEQGLESLCDNCEFSFLRGFAELPESRTTCEFLETLKVESPIPLPRAPRERLHRCRRFSAGAGRVRVICLRLLQSPPRVVTQSLYPLPRNNPAAKASLHRLSQLSHKLTDIAPAILLIDAFPRI